MTSGLDADYARWRMIGKQGADAGRPEFKGMVEHQWDALMRTMSVDGGVEAWMPDYSDLTQEQLYLLLRQMVDVGKASWRREARMDIVPDPVVRCVRHRIPVDAMVITFDGRDYLVAVGTPGRAVLDVGEGSLPRGPVGRVRYLAVGLALAARNFAYRLRYYALGPR